MRGTRHGGRLRHHAKAALGQYTLPMALFPVDRVTLSVTYTVRFMEIEMQMFARRS